MTAAFSWAAFALGVGAGTLNTAGIVASVLGWSEYYPLGERDWRFYTFWGLSSVLNLSLVALGYLQWGTLGLPGWAFPAGVVLSLAGFAVAIAAGRDLGVEETTGVEGELRTDGWYRYSRNPQYVGYVLATVGYPLLTGATLVVPLAGIYLLWWLLFPLAEEPWLRERYGKEYERYARRVPRFVGVKTVQALLGRGTDSRGN